jgi:hypothetical protein
MDGPAFDRLTRSLAATVTRRHGLRLLAAGASLLAGVRGSGTASAQVFLSAGDPCWDSSQCRAADTPLVCADNGFDYDGPLNCCTFEGSRCFADEGCCGSAVCVNGFCATTFSYAGPGDPCSNSSQCLAADTAIYCDFSAATGDQRCCAYEGGRCGWDGGCCGAATCLGGICSNIPLDMGISGPGDPCQNASQCFAADTALTCGYVATTDDYRCCALEGSRCGWDGGCCGWLTCGRDGFCR